MGTYQVAADITANSAAEKGAYARAARLLQLTASSVRSCLAPASSSSSRLALDRKTMKEFNAFISDASEDRKEFVLPLAEKLRGIGLKIWFDEFCLKLGDSLRERIDHGLSNSDYGIVVLVTLFFLRNGRKENLMLCTR